MSVSKRGDIYHYDILKSGVRYRGSTGKRSKAAADTWIRDNYRAIVGEVPAQVETLLSVTNKWFAAEVEGKRSVETVSIRVDILHKHIPPSTPILSIGTPNVAAAMQSRRAEKSKLGRPLAASTVNRDIIDTTLRPIMNYARDVLELPVRAIAWKKVRLEEPMGRTRDFTPEERAAWKRALAPQYHDLWDFYARYGMRLQEAFFKPSRYDPVSGIILVAKANRKNKRDHVIRLLAKDRLAMNRRYARAVQAELPHLWFYEEQGVLLQIQPRAFQAASRIALDAAGIEDARPVHDLRHHAATTLLRGSKDITAAQKMLGHQQIASTMRYAHVLDDDVTAALERTYVTKSPTKTGTPNTKARRIKTIGAAKPVT